MLRWHTSYLHIAKLDFYIHHCNLTKDIIATECISHNFLFSFCSECKEEVIRACLVQDIIFDKKFHFVHALVIMGVGLVSTSFDSLMVLHVLM